MDESIVHCADSVAVSRQCRCGGDDDGGYSGGGNGDDGGNGSNQRSVMSL